MARNYEKNFSRLNRLWLQGKEVKKEKRPKLSTLKTAAEISQWIPSIKDELDFYLKQTEVPCYTEQKIEDCRKRIMYLEAEYKAFVRKLHQVNPRLKTTPWSARPYEKKSQGDTATLKLHPFNPEHQQVLISTFPTPVLMHDILYEETNNEAPWDNSSSDVVDMKSSADNVLLFEIQPSSVNNSLTPSFKEWTEPTERKEKSSLTVCSEEERAPVKHNVLGLDYSSSSDEDT